MTSIQQCDSCKGKGMYVKRHIDGPWLCESCNQMFEQRTLRPTYWYNLAKVIGPNAHLLHDDFYDENGFPVQPEVDIDEDTYRLECIDRKQLSNSREEFIWEYLTRPIIWDERIDRKDWQNAIAQPIITAIIDETEIDEFRDKAYQLLFHYCLDQTKARDIIKKNWMRHSAKHWFTMCKILIKLFSSEESLPLIKIALDGFPTVEIKQRLTVLRFYESTVALPILRNVIRERGVPLMSDLGAVYRCLNPSFDDILTDVNAGRPMSLVAIDSLWIAGSRQYAGYFKGVKCVPIDPPIDILDKILSDYGKLDSAPRVLDAIKLVRKEFKIA